MAIIISIGLAITVIVSYISYLFSTLKRRIYKFIPPIFWLLFSSLFMLNADYFNTDWSKLGYTLFIFISLMPTILSLIYVFILDSRKTKK